MKPIVMDILLLQTSPNEKRRPLKYWRWEYINSVEGEDVEWGREAIESLWTLSARMLNKQKKYSKNGLREELNVESHGVTF